MKLCVRIRIYGVALPALPVLFGSTTGRSTRENYLENIFERSRKFAQNVLGKLGLLLRTRAPAVALYVI